jgi:hypothetical protein
MISLLKKIWKKRFFKRNCYSYEYESNKYNGIVKYYFIKASEMGHIIHKFGPGYGIKDRKNTYHHSRLLALILLFPFGIYITIAIPIFICAFFYNIFHFNLINIFYLMIILLIHITILFNIPKIFSLLIMIKSFRIVMEVVCRSEYINDKDCLLR